MEIINPSKARNPFHDGMEDDLTMAQKRKASAMSGKIAANRARFGLPDTFGVKCPLPPRAINGYLPEYMAVKCPVITATKNRQRLLVIAPDGSDQWVDWK